MEKIYIHSFRTPMGMIRTAATEKGLAILSLPGEPEKQFKSKVSRYFDGYEVSVGGAINRDAEKQVRRYLDGKLTRFTIKLDIQGTEFQKKALGKVARIPYGKTVSYGDIARALGSDGAARAVGSANARNNLPLVIPCHRVVASNGLGGYGGGLAMKTRLLKMEGAL
jgi:O-6-methylguanine DNA methyltransferase